MLNSSYKLPRHGDEYKLRLPIDSTWRDSSRRVLLVLETIDSEDLKNGALLYKRSRQVLAATLKMAREQARAHDVDLSGIAYAAINFNNEKFLDKPPTQHGAYRNRFATRVVNAIKDLDPTDIIVFGDKAMHYLVPELEVPEMKRGWVHRIKIGGARRRVTSSLDLESLYSIKRSPDADEDEDEDDDDENKDIYGKCNLIFYVSRNVANALAKYNLYDLSYIAADPIYVDSISKFDAFWEKLTKATYVAVDTETANLTVLHNAIHTIQFAFSTERGYFIPLDHPQAKWTDKERRYIKKKLRQFFMSSGEYPVKWLITQYGMFDLRMLRQQLGIPVIQIPVWEISAGESQLDENIKFLAKYGTPHGGLEQIFMYYGNDAYRRSTFGKEDRSNSSLTTLDNPGFISYGSLDVQSIYGICKMQRKRASFLKLGDAEFGPYYRRFVSCQMSNTVHAISHMMNRGALIDMAYLAQLKSKDGKFVKLLKDTEDQIYKFPEAETANRIILKEKGSVSSGSGLFGKQPFALDLAKMDHKIVLFFTVLGLKPISFTKQKQPQVNKTFIKAYSDNPVVKLFGLWSKLNKLFNTYVKGRWLKMRENADSKTDNRLRASYGFFDVVTGRLNSFDPSLQQEPARGDESKYIKRMFIAGKGRLLFKFDYSAHEVRVWSIISGDKVLAAVFKIGQSLRQAFRKKPSPELADRIKKEGDIHIINVKFFFDLLIDKTHPLRDAIKAVIFGVIYGKSARTLSKDIGAEVPELKKKILAAKSKLKGKMTSKERQTLEAELEALKTRLEDAKERSTTEFAQSLIDKLFNRFKAAANWLNWTKGHAKIEGYTYNLFGSRRNLQSVFMGIDSIIAAMMRRAMNSPIQGMASQIGITAARLIVIEFYKTLLALGLADETTTELPAEPEKAVHDALYSAPTYETYLIYLHVTQWVATYGVTKYYKEVFGVDFTVEPEIEVEIGAEESTMIKWDWSNDHLKAAIRSSLERQKEIGQCDDVEAQFKKIFAPYKDPKIRAYLNKHYPILGVEE